MNEEKFNNLINDSTSENEMILKLKIHHNDILFHHLPMNNLAKYLVLVVDTKTLEQYAKHLPKEYYYIFENISISDFNIIFGSFRHSSIIDFFSKLENINIDLLKHICDTYCVNIIIPLSFFKTIVENDIDYFYSKIGERIVYFCNRYINTEFCPKNNNSAYFLSIYKLKNKLEN